MVIQKLFESADVLVVDKPAGWLSVPSRFGAKDPRPCVQIELSKAGAEKLWPVHRLDEDVSGVLVFARNAAVHRTLCDAFESRQAVKTYEAWTAVPAVPSGVDPGQEFSWASKLVRGKKRTFEAPHGKEALTQATYSGPIETPFGRLGLWRLQPKTGRSHQLRVHLMKAGFPIVGDTLYGGASPFLAGAIALRHVRLELPGLPAFEVAGLGPWVRQTMKE